MQLESIDLADHDSLASPAWDWGGALLAIQKIRKKTWFSQKRSISARLKRLGFPKKDRFQLADGVYIGFIAGMIAASVIDFLR